MLDTANSQWNNILSLNSANAYTCVYRQELQCGVGWSKTLPLSMSDHCIPCLFPIKVTATDHEQNTLLHHSTSVYYSNWASLWFTTYSVFKTVERKHHLWERDLSSKSWSSDLKPCQGIASQPLSQSHLLPQASSLHRPCWHGASSTRDNPSPANSQQQAWGY